MVTHLLVSKTVLSASLNKTFPFLRFQNEHLTVTRNHDNTYNHDRQSSIRNCRLRRLRPHAGHFGGNRYIPCHFRRKTEKHAGISDGGQEYELPSGGAVSPGEFLLGVDAAGDPGRDVRVRHDVLDLGVQRRPRATDRRLPVRPHVLQTQGRQRLPGELVSPEWGSGT